MAVTAVTITNPGAESGSLTGWTNVNRFYYASGAVGAVSPHGGTQMFATFRDGVGGSTGLMYQDVTLPGGISASIDAGTIAVMAKCWLQIKAPFSGQDEAGYIYLEFLDAAGTTIIGSHNRENPKTYQPNAGSWLQIKESSYLPVGTRKVRIVAVSFRTAGFGNESFWDDFTLDYSTTPAADWPSTAKASMEGVYILGAAPADGAIANNLGANAVVQKDAAEGPHQVLSHQLGAYALVRGMADRENLRAWQFPQDDHVFYVLQLGNENGTLIHDSLTREWAMWKSPNYPFWRGADGLDWEGMNVCCDIFSGKIFKIDPEGRLDYGTTPITSVIVGGLTERFRKHVQCFMAELAVSEDQPADVSGTISLRVGDGKDNWFDHGAASLTDENVSVRWYGLGLIKSPGTVFELTDTGYARRIDGLNIEVTGNGGQ